MQTNGDIIKSVEVNKGVNQTVNLVYSENAGTLIKKGEDKNIEEIISISDNICAPISKGQKLGEIQYCLNGNIIEKVNLVAENDIKKIGLNNMLGEILSNWFCVLR